MMDEMSMREKIARAAFPYSWIELDEGRSRAGSGDHHDSMRDMSLERADAVLDAMREPTPEMVKAASGFFVSIVQLPLIWQTMLHAARNPVSGLSGE